MSKLIQSVALVTMLLGTAQASLGGERCITGGWPVSCSAVATTGTVQQVTLGSVSTAGSAVVCLIDSRVFHALASAGIGLDSTKMGVILFLR